MERSSLVHARDPSANGGHRRACLKLKLSSLDTSGPSGPSEEKAAPAQRIPWATAFRSSGPWATREVAHDDGVRIEAREREPGEDVPESLPTKPCRVCRTSAWYRQPSGMVVCGTCHPAPAQLAAGGAGR